MSEAALLLVGVALISLAVTHHLWGIVRALRLRQDIFDLRDELFDAAAKNGSLADPAYRETRDQLNALAQTTGMLSIPACACILTSPASVRAVGTQATPRPSAQNPKMQKKLESARHRLSGRLTRYLLLESLSGWMLLAVLLLVLFPMLVSAAARRGLKARAQQLSEQVLQQSLDCAPMATAC